MRRNFSFSLEVDFILLRNARIFLFLRPAPEEDVTHVVLDNNRL